MIASFNNAAEIVRKVYTLARPYGLKKLLLVSGCSLAQGVFQVLGVTSVFPFLALAADTERLRNSQFGRRFLEFLPEMGDSELLVFAGVFAIVMLFLSNCVNLGAEFIRTRYAHRFGHWLRIQLLRKISTRPYTDFLQENSSVLVKKIVSDVIQFASGVLLPLLDSFARLATIVFLIGMLFLVHPGIAIGASLILGVFYLIVFRIFGRWRRITVDGVKTANRGCTTEAYQMLSGIKAVKVHRAEEPFIGRFSTHSSRLARLMAWIGIVGNGPRYLLEPLAFGGVVAVVLIYASRGQDFSAILPNLGVMALAGYRLLPALQLLYGQINQLATTRHALDEVFDEFLAAEKCSDAEGETISGRLSAPEPIEWSQSITLEKIHFKYPGAAREVIRELSLTIPKNSSLGIVGTTGSGKSTLVDIILGLHTPTSGQILVDQAPLSSEMRRAWRGGVGYVPQEIFLIDDSVKANIAFGVPANEVDSTSLRRAAEAAQILPFIEEELPKKWETVVGERGVRLSGGQRQRIGLARALYHNPKLLVLDEATSALDNETESEVLRAIETLKGTLTMVVIAHRLSTIEKCTHHLDLSSEFPSVRANETL